MTLTIRLPEPPSANAYWRSVTIGGRARVLLSREARAYKAAVASQCDRTPGLVLGRYYADVPLRLTLTWHRSKRMGDLSNRIKVLEDALNGLLWVDDKQIEEIHAFRRESPRDGYVDVSVEPTTLDDPQ